MLSEQVAGSPRNAQTIQPDCPNRMARAVSLQQHRRGAGARHTMAHSTIVLEPMANKVSSYNNERPNMGIGGMTPMQKLKAA